MRDEAERSALVPGAPTFVSTGAGWESLQIQSFDLPAFEIALHAPLQHIIVVSHVPAPTRAVRRFEQQRQTEWLVSGHVVVVPALTRYAVRVDGPGRYTLAVIEPALEESLVEESTGAAGVRLNAAFAHPDPLAASLIADLEVQARSGIAEPLAVQSAAALLAAHLLRTHGSPLALRPSEGDGKRNILRAVELIEDRIAASPSLADLAEAAGMSRFSLIREFQRQTGMAPHQYILRRRIERARVLLRKGVMPIGEIAAHLGFSSPSHFAAQFHRIVGLTPRAYRDQQGERERTNVDEPDDIRHQYEQR